MAGYVYLIGTPIFGWYKIGKSKTPEVRIKDLGILLPFKLHIERRKSRNQDSEAG